MKLYFDTNIIIDILKYREPFFENSNKIFMLAAEEKIEGIVGTNAITDIYYLIRKQYADTETADYIITRNTKDYSKSPVPAIAPAEFLTL